MPMGSCSNVQDDEKTHLLAVQLPERDVCKLLNSIDRIGFLDYDAATYQFDEGVIFGPPFYDIEVNAWRSKNVSLFNLGSFINEKDRYQKTCNDRPFSCFTFPTIPPALRNMYELMENYSHENLNIYQPGRVGIWVEPYQTNEDKKPWPAHFPRLANLTEQVSANGIISFPELIVEGDIAGKIFAFFDQALPGCGWYISDEGKEYRVFARPLLPDEFTTRSTIVRKPISCQPADGVIDVEP